MIVHDITPAKNLNEQVPPYSGTGNTQAYSTPGEFDFTVPNGISVIRAKLWGAAGGDNGGGGAFVQCDIRVKPGEVLRVRVGDGGMASVQPSALTYPKLFGGGLPGSSFRGANGARIGAQGGGFSALFRANREVLAVAGGGGAADGGPGVANSGSGSDGSQTAGGTNTLGTNSANGGFLAGGKGADDYATSGTMNTGGGGGAGYYGGAGGSGNNVTGGTQYMPGGGGSSWAHPAQAANVTKTSGSGTSPANGGDANYAGSAGQGNSAAAGNPGRVVLLY